MCCVAAGEHPVSDEDRQPGQDHRLRAGARAQRGRRHARAVRDTRVHGARGRPVRADTLRHRHVEHRRHRLRPVRATRKHLLCSPTPRADCLYYDVAAAWRSG